MDGRIDLTENRDFRDSDNEGAIRIGNRTIRLRTLFPPIKIKKIIIFKNNELKLEDPQDVFPTYECECCGKKIFTYGLCQKCDDSLEWDCLTKELFKKEEIRSLF